MNEGGVGSTSTTISKKANQQRNTRRPFKGRDEEIHSCSFVFQQSVSASRETGHCYMLSSGKPEVDEEGE